MSGRSKWLLFIVIVVVGICGGLTWYVIHSREGSARPNAQQQATSQPSRLSKDKSGQTVITIRSDEHGAIAVQSLVAASYQPEVIAFGTLQDDPSNSFILRAPFAGTIRAAPNHPFPTLGDTLPAGVVQVGFVEPRFTPVEHVDLASKLSAAQADVSTADAALAAARAEYEADVKLNEQDKNVSDRTVQAARAKMDEQSAKLKSARQTVTFLEAAASATTRPAASFPLTVEGTSQVVDVTAQPGETIDSGQAILRVARFNSLLAAVALPAGQNVDPSSISARVVALGSNDHPLSVRQITLAPAVDAKTLGQTLLVQVDTRGRLLRAGTPVTAWLTLSKAAQGVLVPRDAVVWHEDKAWVYAQSASDSFVRREVPMDRPTKEGWFVASGLSPGERIVVQGAQQLLSEEFKPVLPAGGDVDLD